jgi:hypothetical protein
MKRHWASCTKKQQGVLLKLYEGDTCAGFKSKNMRASHKMQDKVRSLAKKRYKTEKRLEK